MIKIKKKNNLLQIKILEFKQTKFEQGIEIIKQFPVKYYDAKNKAWLLPDYDFANLNNILTSKGFDIKVNKSIKLFDKLFRSWSKYQIKLRNYYRIKNPSNHHIEFIKNEMDLLKIKLYPFQSVGSYFAYKSKGAIIADMVGLGKTVQALAAAEKRMQTGQTDFNIIICPSTLKRNWELEIGKFTNRSNLVIQGTKSKRIKYYKHACKFDYIILNYDLLIHDIKEIKEYILDKTWLKINLIMDEIQYINNKNSHRAKITKEISKFCQFRLGLSATLVENKVTDLFSSFQAIDENIFGNNNNYYNFINNFCVLDYFGNPVGYRNTHIMKKRMHPFLIRRLKEDVLDELPDRVENNYWIKLSPIQRKMYDDVKHKIVKEIQDMQKAEKIVMAKIFPMLVYLRMCLLSTKLVGYESDISTKADELYGFFKSLDDKSKVVIFCHHPQMVELIYDRLIKHGINCIAMHANKKYEHIVHMKDRVDLVKKFDESNKIKCLITSDILREGVNILSANYIVNFDLLFNPYKMEQRIGRLDRIGNKHKVINIINFIAEDTVDNNVYEKILTKRKMGTEIMDDGREESRLTLKNITSLFDI